MSKDERPIRLGDWDSACTLEQRIMHAEGMETLRETYANLLLMAMRFRDAAGTVGAVNEDGERLTGRTWNRMHAIGEGAYDAARVLDAAVGYDWATKERERLGFVGPYRRVYGSPSPDDATPPPGP